MRRTLSILLLGVLLGASMLSPAWAGGEVTKRWVKSYVKKQVKPLQRSCRNGAVLAFASVSANGQPQDGQFHATPGFNCAGGSVKVKDIGAPLEEFIVRFTGLGLTHPNPDLVAIVTPKVGGIMGTAQSNGPNEIIVYLIGADEQSYDADFSIAVLKA